MFFIFYLHITDKGYTTGNKATAYAAETKCLNKDLIGDIMKFTGIGKIGTFFRKAAEELLPVDKYHAPIETLAEIVERYIAVRYGLYTEDFTPRRQSEGYPIDDAMIGYLEEEDQQHLEEVDQEIDQLEADIAEIKNKRSENRDEIIRVTRLLFMTPKMLNPRAKPRLKVDDKTPFEDVYKDWRSHTGAAFFKNIEAVVHKLEKDIQRDIRELSSYTRQLFISKDVRTLKELTALNEQLIDMGNQVKNVRNGFGWNTIRVKGPEQHNDEI